VCEPARVTKSEIKSEIRVRDRERERKRERKRERETEREREDQRDSDRVSECADSCCTLYSSEGGFGVHTVDERPAWAPGGADIMNADIARCIDRSGHTLGCVDLKKWRVEGNKVGI
jgi:hypothetical protein